MKLQSIVTLAGFLNVFVWSSDLSFYDYSGDELLPFLAQQKPNEILSNVTEASGADIFKRQTCASGYGLCSSKSSFRSVGLISKVRSDSIFRWWLLPSVQCLLCIWMRSSRIAMLFKWKIL